jgi:hypothetical protein
MFFQMDPIRAVRSVYKTNPFPEAVCVADLLRTHSSKQTKIAVLGSEPEIYFYAHRHSATGFIYTYGLTEPQTFALQMQKEMAAEIETSAPEFLVYVKQPNSWLARPESEQFIFYWAQEYLNKAYEPVGSVYISNPPECRWRSGQEPDSQYLSVYKRKP